MAQIRRKPEAVTPLLEQTARRRADLHEAIVELERAAARPASGRGAAWAELVLGALSALQAEIVVHVERTEGPDGLHAEIEQVAPRLRHMMDVLRGEHVRMQDDVAALIAWLRETEIVDAGSVERARDDVRRLLGLLVRHRQRGSDLVWEAYTLDIGDTE